MFPERRDDDRGATGDARFGCAKLGWMHRTDEIHGVT